MFNLRSLIFSQPSQAPQSQEFNASVKPQLSFSSSQSSSSSSQQQSQQQSRSSYKNDINNKTDIPDDSTEETVQHEYVKYKQRGLKKRGTKYMNDTPLFKEGAKLFSKIYYSTPNIACTRLRKRYADNTFIQVYCHF